MGRPRAITDEEIIAAARTVFLERGIGATTAEVAARCGVGEATLFRRFPTKQALMKAALEFEGEPPWAQMVFDRIGTDDPRAALVDLGKLFIAWARKVLPARLMQMSNPLREGQKRRPLQLVIDRALLEMFQEAHRSGRLRVDPLVAAHVYLGALRDHALRELMHMGDELSEETLLEGLAALLCGEPKKKKRRRR
jgi:AcrR family transcriptional regulator